MQQNEVAAMPYIHTDLVELLRQSSSVVQRYAHTHADEVAACMEINRAERQRRDANSCTPLDDALHATLTPTPALTAAWSELYTSILKIQAPMVRCSRPSFRKLCRVWGTDISYTHMLLAESVSQSEQARQAEFSRYNGESRLIVQLAAKSGPDAARAAAIFAPYCDAIDINCGCPQRWAIQEGVGAGLLTQPELVADLVRSVRNVGGARPLPCVVKMRVEEDVAKSVNFARQCEAAGAAWLTVHGRTPLCSASAPPRWDDMRIIRESVDIPVVANGGVTGPNTAVAAALACGVGGVMAGNALLDNPAAFHLPQQHRTCADSQELVVGSSAAPSRCMPAVLPHIATTPREVVSDFMRAALYSNLAYTATNQHTIRMARMYLSPAERAHVALLRSNTALWQALDEVGILVPEGRLQYNINGPINL